VREALSLLIGFPFQPTCRIPVGMSFHAVMTCYASNRFYFSIAILIADEKQAQGSTRLQLLGIKKIVCCKG
jgi:hypothetical protein